MRKRIFSSIYQDKTINGLKTYMIKQDISDNFVAGIFLPYGANMREYLIDGKMVKEGSAHFLEHRLFDSINGDVSSLCASLGLECNAETAITYTFYYIYGPKKSILKALQILFDMFFYIKRDDKKLLLERKIILSEAKETCDSYLDRFERNVIKKTLKKTFFENSIIGSNKEIKSINYDDLILYHEAFYQKENAKFVMLGNFNFARVEDFINNYQFNKQKKHEISFIKKIIEQKKYNEHKKKNIPNDIFNLSFVINNQINHKYGLNKMYLLNYLDDVINCSPLIEKLKKNGVLKYDLTITSFYSDSLFYLSFLGYKDDKNMKRIIINDILKQIPNYITDEDLISYQKGAKFETIFNYDNIFVLIDRIIEILDNKQDPYVTFTRYDQFKIEEFYNFINDILKNSIISYFTWDKKEEK